MTERMKMSNRPRNDGGENDVLEVRSVETRISPGNADSSGATFKIAVFSSATTLSGVLGTWNATGHGALAGTIVVAMIAYCLLATALSLLLGERLPATFKHLQQLPVPPVKEGTGSGKKKDELHGGGRKGHDGGMAGIKVGQGRRTGSIVLACAAAFVTVIAGTSSQGGGTSIVIPLAIAAGLLIPSALLAGGRFREQDPDIVGRLLVASTISLGLVFGTSILVILPPLTTIACTVAVFLMIYLYLDQPLRMLPLNVTLQGIIGTGTVASFFLVPGITWTYLLALLVVEAALSAMLSLLAFRGRPWDAATRAGLKAAIFLVLLVHFAAIM